MHPLQGSLRRKLWLGFGGLLAILATVSVLSIVVFTRYSRALERVFRENYDSAVYCDAMNASLDQINGGAQALLWDEPGSQLADSSAAKSRFEQNLERQLANVSLPGERELSFQLRSMWQEYESRLARFERAGADRRSMYRSDLLPTYEALKRTAQRVADMNMSNMVSVDGRAKRTLISVRNALLVLMIAGTLLAVVLGGAVATGIKLQHEKLSRTQQTTQLAIDSLPDAVCIIGPGGLVEIANEMAAAHLGIKRGISVDALKLDWLSKLYHSVLSDGKPLESQGYQSAIQLFDQGRERFLLPRAVPMRDARGQVIGVTVILVDVTGLRQIDEAKSGLVSTVSHELRTPLTSVRMTVGLLANEKLGPLNVQQRQLVYAARDDSERLYRIIDNLLNMSRMESGQARFVFRPTPAAEIVAAALDPLRGRFSERRMQLSVDVEAEIDVMADATCAPLALSNFLTNALKYAATSSRISIKVSAQGEFAVFTVSDDGPGIPERFVPRLFEKFFRVPSESGPHGAGLGLAIARDIAQAHGGRVQFAPSSAGGCSFSLLLPLSSALVADTDAPSSPAHATS